MLTINKQTIKIQTHKCTHWHTNIIFCCCNMSLVLFLINSIGKEIMWKDRKRSLNVIVIRWEKRLVQRCNVLKGSYLISFFKWIEMKWNLNNRNSKQVNKQTIDNILTIVWPIISYNTVCYSMHINRFEFIFAIVIIHT